MKYFRVKYGYGKDDFLSVDETEVGKAIRAQINGTVAVFSTGTLSGNSIMAIMPDYNREMGWKRDYPLTGEDYDQIGAERQKEYQLFLEDAKRVVLGKEAPRIIGPEVKRIAKSMSVGSNHRPHENH